MTLIEYPEMVQGSQEWHDVRRGIVTASVVGRLITPSTVKPASNDYSRALTAQLAAERITGYTEPTWMNADMMRGVEDEPFARDIYSAHFAPAVETGFMVEDKWCFKLGFSPDGLVGADGLIEIKSRRQKKQLETILADEVPAGNMAQLQAGLLITGRAWIDYVSYCGGMPLYVKRVEPDQRWFVAILEAAFRCEETITRMTADYEAAVAGLPLTERIDHNLVELKLA